MARLSNAQLAGYCKLWPNVRVPGEPHGLGARQMAYAIARAESGGDPGAPGGGMWQLYPAGSNDPRRNAAGAILKSVGGINWRPWCTAYGDACQCGTIGGSYLKPASSAWGCDGACGYGPCHISGPAGSPPAYYAHVSEAITALGGSVPATKGKPPPKTDATVASTSTLSSGGCPWYCGITKIGIIPLPGQGAVLPGCKGCLSSDLSGLSAVWDKVFAVLKIGSGGIVMFAGLAVIVTGATGTSSKASQAVTSRFGAIPRVQERRAAKSYQRQTRATEARSRGESRVVVSQGKRTKVRIVSRRQERAEVAEARTEAPRIRAERQRASLKALRSRPHKGERMGRMEESR